MWVPGCAEGVVPAWMPALGLGCWTGQDESRRDAELLARAVMRGTALRLRGFGV